MVKEIKNVLQCSKYRTRAPDYDVHREIFHFNIITATVTTFKAESAVSEDHLLSLLEMSWAAVGRKVAEIGSLTERVFRVIHVFQNDVSIILEFG